MPVFFNTMKNKITRFIRKYVLTRKSHDEIRQRWFDMYVELDGRLRDARLSHLASQEAAARQYNAAIDNDRLAYSVILAGLTEQYQKEIDRDRFAYTLALEVADQEITELKERWNKLQKLKEKYKCSQTNLKRKKKD